MSFCLILLAAGDSKRFNSKIPKPFDKIAGKTLLELSLTKFNKIGFDVIGASKDPVDRNKKFSDKYKLKYPLGSDEGKNCDKLGIWIEKSMYGRKYFGIDRSTFVIDKNGKILNSWNKVKVKGHVEEVYNFCKDQ